MRGQGLAFSVAVIMLAGAAGLGGCAQSVIPSSAPVSPPSPDIFDWINAKPDQASQSDRASPNSGAVAGQAEIYYGTDGDNTHLANANRGGVQFANLNVGNARDAQSGGQRAQVDDPVTRTPNNGVNLNFDNAEIKTVARAILGEVLNLNYAIDPRVTGTISLSTRRPVDRNQLLPLIENALRAQGAVLVREAGIYRILPDKESLGPGQTNVGRDAGAEGFGITALPLEYISADALSKILDGFGAPPRSVRIDAEHNLLIVRGTYTERQQLIDTALAFDVDWMAKQSVGIFPLQSSSPEAVISELGKMVDPNLVRFQPIGRMNAILAVSKSRSTIQKVATWISRLDRQSDAGARVRVFRLKYADARRVAGLIRSVFGVSGGGVGGPLESGSQIAPGMAPVTSRVAAATTPTPGTAGAPAQPAQADTQADSGEGEFAGAGAEATGTASRIRVTADLAINAVVVYASQEDAQLIQRAIQDLDRPPVQVAVEATIAEITLNDTLSNGVQFYLTSKNHGSISNLSSEGLPLKKLVPGLNLLLGPDINPRLVLDALREVTDVKVLSSPSLVVLNNQSAVLQVGDQVPITTRTAQDVTNPTAPIVNSIDFRDTGVILRVTPRVNANSLVGIEIEQEISAVKNTDGTNTASTSSTLTPTISTRKVKSTISVGDGQTVLLAGLISEQRNYGKSGIPGVIDIPILGNIIAGRHQDGNTRTELIIFIKPRVVRDPVDARRVAEDLRRRMKAFERW